MALTTDTDTRKPTWASLLFSFRGRINRETYWTWFLLAAIAEIALTYLNFSISFAISDALAAHRPAQFGMLLALGSVAFGFLLVLDWIGFALQTKRLHDRGHSGWWTLLVFVPIVGSFCVEAYTALLRGNPGANRYGPPAPGRRGTLAMTAAFIAGLLLLGGLLYAGRSYIAEPFDIPSGSNVPTLLPGDLVMTSRRLSLTRSPQYGDLVVFTNPNTGEDLIKRVVALPGDRVQFRRGVLVLNDTPWPRGRVADYEYRYWDEGFGHTVTERRYRYIETMPNGIEHEILGATTDAPEDSLPQDNTRVFVVPDGRFFVVGDNRDNSMDSRFALGAVPREALLGKAQYIYFSSEDRGGFWEALKISPWIRWSRLFKVIR